MQEEYVFEYLKNVYSTILLRDIVQRENIRNVQLLSDLVSHLADKVGSLFSATNIAKYLKSQRQNVSVQTILNYLLSIQNAYFIHAVKRYDISGLRLFEVGEKYYFEDLGLRNVIRGFNKRNDIQKLMENVVFLHLKKLGYNVYVGKLGDLEIDFVATKNGITSYFQIAYQITEKETETREFGNLLKINDDYAKYVITMEELNSNTNYQGINQLALKDFLMKSEL